MIDQSEHPRLAPKLRGTRVLLALPQLPQDPASGAARSMRTIAMMLSDAGADVRAVGTTASERGVAFNAIEYLQAAGLRPRFTRPGRRTRDFGVLSFVDGAIRCTLAHTPGRSPETAEDGFPGALDAVFDTELTAHKPDIVLTFGGRPEDDLRRIRARSAGAAVVFGLRNHSYIGWDFPSIDAVLTPSRFITDSYMRKIGLKSTPLPTPVNESETVPHEHEPVFFTMVNPSLHKGVMFLATLAERLGARRPDIPLLVIESRGSAGSLLRAGIAGGFDLRRHASIHISPGVPKPAEIYAPTRALLVPSVWAEPSGRVAAEALINGIPPIVSDRGGLPETCREGGFVLPLPAGLTTRTRTPPAIDDPCVLRWMGLIERLADDTAFYAESASGSRAAGSVYRSANLAPRYVSFFQSVTRQPTVIDDSLRSPHASAAHE